MNCLRQRYGGNLIHTYAGSNMVVINPLSTPSMYSEKVCLWQMVRGSYLCCSSIFLFLLMIIVEKHNQQISQKNHSSHEFIRVVSGKVILEESEHSSGTVTACFLPQWKFNCQMPSSSHLKHLFHIWNFLLTHIFANNLVGSEVFQNMDDVKYFVCDSLSFNHQVMHMFKGCRREDSAPHIYSVAQSAYRSLLTTRQDQSLVLLGKSGSGKTTNCQHLVQYLVSIAGSTGKIFSGEPAHKKTRKWIHDKYSWIDAVDSDCTVTIELWHTVVKRDITCIVDYVVRLRYCTSQCDKQVVSPDKLLYLEVNWTQQRYSINARHFVDNCGKYIYWSIKCL